MYSNCQIAYDQLKRPAISKFGWNKFPNENSQLFNAKSKNTFPRMKILKQTIFKSSCLARLLNFDYHRFRKVKKERQCKWSVKVASCKTVFSVAYFSAISLNKRLVFCCFKRVKTETNGIKWDDSSKTFAKGIFWQSLDIVLPELC